jgi:DNA-binding LytR/AlgR family response regulator
VRFGISSEDKAFRASLRQAICVWSAGVCATVTTDEWANLPAYLNCDAENACEILFLDADCASMQWNAVPDRLNGQSALFVCSNSPLAAINCYALHPRGFLTKQVTAETLERSLYPSIGLWRKALATLDLTVGRNRVRLPVCELIWAEARGRSCVLHSAHGQITVNETLQELSTKLPAGLFLRCQKSFLVNLRHVRSIGNGMLTMSDGAEVPVGRNSRNDVQKAHAAFRELWTLCHYQT